MKNYIAISVSHAREHHREVMSAIIRKTSTDGLPINENDIARYVHNFRQLRGTALAAARAVKKFNR